MEHPCTNIFLCVLSEKVLKTLSVDPTILRNGPIEKPNKSHVYALTPCNPVVLALSPTPKGITINLAQMCMSLNMLSKNEVPV